MLRQQSQKCALLEAIAMYFMIIYAMIFLQITCFQSRTLLLIKKHCQGLNETANYDFILLIARLVSVTSKQEQRTSGNSLRNQN